MERPRDVRASRDRRERRTLLLALLASAVVHVLLVWATASVGIRSSPYALPPVETTPAPEGLVVVDVAPGEVPEDVEDPRPEPAQPQAERPEPREMQVVDVPAQAVPGAPGAVPVEGPEAAAAAEEAGMTNAERLTPRFVDARIWFDPRDPLLFGDRLERFARADSAVRAILRDWLDSLRLDDEQRRRAMDWTFEKDGERWGVSPEGLHLGDITIPIPFGFAPSGPRRREFEQAIRDLTEIQLQNLRSDIEEVADERRRAMEERTEEEVRRRSGDTTRVRRPPFRGGAPRGPPDG